MKKKVYTVTVKFVMSGPLVVTSQSTDDIDQAMRFTSSLAGSVESAMRLYGNFRLDELEVSISVKDVDESEIPDHPGKKWFWCTLGGDTYRDVFDIPSGGDPIDEVDSYSLALDLASPIPAYKLEGKLFEHWYEVVEYCKNKLG